MEILNTKLRLCNGNIICSYVNFSFNLSCSSSKKLTVKTNLPLPPSGTEDDSLDNDNTLKFSNHTCWSRVQPDLFWPL